MIYLRRWYRVEKGYSPGILLGGGSGAGIGAQSQGSQKGREVMWPQKNYLSRRTGKGSGREQDRFCTIYWGMKTSTCFLPNDKILPRVNAQVSSLGLPSMAHPMKLSHQTHRLSTRACPPFPLGFSQRRSRSPETGQLARSPVSLSNGSHRARLGGSGVRGRAPAKYSSAAHFKNKAKCKKTG